MKNAYKVTLYRASADRPQDDLFLVKTINGPGPDITLQDADHYGKVVSAGERIDRATAIALGWVANITTTAWGIGEKES